MTPTIQPPTDSRGRLWADEEVKAYVTAIWRLAAEIDDSEIALATPAIEPATDAQIKARLELETAKILAINPNYTLSSAGFSLSSFSGFSYAAYAANYAKGSPLGSILVDHFHESQSAKNGATMDSTIEELARKLNAEAKP